jgi:hypothetical protein
LNYCVITFIGHFSDSALNKFKRCYPKGHVLLRKILRTRRKRIFCCPSKPRKRTNKIFKKYMCRVLARRLSIYKKSQGFHTGRFKIKKILKTSTNIKSKISFKKLLLVNCYFFGNCLYMILGFSLYKYK